MPSAKTIMNGAVIANSTAAAPLFPLRQNRSSDLTKLSSIGKIIPAAQAW
jgi:hypothetical protein